MKKILCFFMVALLAALLVFPCFAAETSVDRGDPVDWFGGVAYSCSVSGYNNVKGFLQLNSASTVDTAFHVINGVATYSGTSYNFDSFFYTSGADLKYFLGDTQVYSSSTGNPSVTFTLASLDGVEAQNYLTISEFGSEGFVDAGFSDALTELSTIVSAILSNQYILIAIGLAVAVPLVAWGISKLKSLVKGY